MKTEISSLDLFYLVKELKSLEGAKIYKIYEQDAREEATSQISKLATPVERKDFLFVVHKTGPGRQMMRIKLPGLIYLTNFKPDFPDTPPGFCTFLRKHLGNARIREIRQKGFERILEIVFDTKEGERILVCELFSKGNMILLDHELKIKGLLESQNWEARTIRGGTLYQYPPMQVETQKLTMIEFEKIVTSSQMDQIVKCFAVELGLGGLYAEELCIMAGIPKEKKRLSFDELNAAYRELGALFRRPIEANVVGNEILPFKTSKIAEKTFETFSAAIDEMLTEKLESARGHKQEKEKETKQKKTMLVVEKQKERLAELEKEVLDNQRRGELIYEHYIDISKLLEDINSDRKKMDWEELKKKYKNIEIDEKKGTISFEIKSQ